VKQSCPHTYSLSLFFSSFPLSSRKTQVPYTLQFFSHFFFSASQFLSLPTYSLPATTILFTVSFENEGNMGQGPFLDLLLPENVTLLSAKHQDTSLDSFTFTPSHLIGVSCTSHEYARDASGLYFFQNFLFSLFSPL